MSIKSVIITACITPFIITGCSDGSSNQSKESRSQEEVINPTYAYIANRGNDSISLRKIEKNGEFLSKFTDSGTTGSGFNSPGVIAISNGFAYVTNYKANSVSKCTFEKNTGEFKDCKSQKFDFQVGPSSLTIHNNFAYITDNKNIKFFKIDPDTGELYDLQETDFSIDGPHDVNFFNGFAYVTNFNGKSITKCQVDNNTGELDDCKSTGPDTFNESVFITRVDNSVYVTNGNKINLCEIISDTGELSNCKVLQKQFKTPRKIVFINK
jgi:6-phosphogluconolactonase (cycloisomerase 2 family)